MALLVLSASHHDLDLDVLEQLSSGARSVGPAAVAHASLAGCVVLATCNRFELYLDTARPGPDDADPGAAAGAAAATAAVAERAGLPVDDVRHALRARTGALAVAQHLFGVAAGLDAMVVGEREVAGQVRRALAGARADGTTTSDLERLFQWASRASRAVGAATALGSSGRSVVAVALDLAAHALADGAAACPALPAPAEPAAAPDATVDATVEPAESGDVPADAPAGLAGVSALLVGTGSYARAAVSALRRRGVRRIAVHSPSGRAAEFAESRGLAAVPPGGLAAALADADLVVACSGAHGPVLGADDVRAALAARAEGTSPGSRGAAPARRMAVVDLALRHDVDPAVGALDGVTLVDLATVQQHAGFVALEVGDGWEIVAAHAARFAESVAEREVAPAVVALRGYVQGLLDEEIRRSGPRTPDEERNLRRFAARLLHLSALRAREHARRGEADAYREAVETLLGVDLPDAR